MDYAPVLLTAVFAALALVLFSLSARSPKAPKGTTLPPGPKGQPFLGHVRLIPATYRWLQFDKWARHFGPLYRLNFAGQENYVVSTEQVAQDLLRDRGNIYSSRPRFPAGAELLSGGLRPLLYPYGELFRRGRKMMHQVCKDSAAATYEPMQSLESTRMLHDLIQDPEGYEELLVRYGSGLIFRLAFGRVMEDLQDSYLYRLKAFLRILAASLTPGTYLVDTFPLLMKLPDWIVPAKRALKKLHLGELALFREPLDEIKQLADQGHTVPCWEKTFLDYKDEYGITMDEGAYMIGTLFEAGSATTAEAMCSWLLAMVHHPKELEKLQHEIDEVVGDVRLPQFSDMPNLPRVRAVVKETARWRPVTASGIPHQSIKDDIYKGYFIPAGTNIHWNLWSIMREEALYPDAESFIPDRWLDPKYPTTYREPLTKFPNMQNYAFFGFGRRICPGMHIAERSLNLLVARIAWACHIGKKIGPDGKEIAVPLYNYEGTVNTKPRRFKFSLVARSQERWRIVEEAYRREMEADPLKTRRKRGSQG